MSSNLTCWASSTGLLLILAGVLAPTRAQEPFDDETADAQIDQGIEVKLASFRYHPDTLRIPSEKTVKLVFHNEGNFAHEFVAGRGVTEEMIGYQNDLFEDVEVHKSKTDSDREERKRQGTSLVVEPDSTQSLTFQLPSSKQGQWEMGCFLTNPSPHYEAGMKGTVIVE